MDGSPMPNSTAIQASEVNYSGCLKNGSSSSRISMGSGRIIWAFQIRNVFTPTIASKCDGSTGPTTTASQRLLFRSLSTPDANTVVASHVLDTAGRNPRFLGG